MHAGRDDRLETDLPRLPETLYDLWDEYTVGLEDCKPTILYTSTEKERERGVITSTPGGRWYGARLRNLSLVDIPLMLQST